MRCPEIALGLGPTNHSALQPHYQSTTVLQRIQLHLQPNSFSLLTAITAYLHTTHEGDTKYLDRIAFIRSPDTT